MFNISDILKKHKDDKNKTPPSESKEIKKAEESISKVEPVAVQNSGLKISASFGQDLQEAQFLKSSDTYNRALALARIIYDPSVKLSKESIGDLKALIENLVNLLREGNMEIIRFCLMEYPDPKDYLFYHVVNVSIISLEIGLGLNYEHDRLIELGLASFLHDIGMAGFFDLITKNKSLTKEEFNKIKQHPKIGLDILENIKDSALSRIVLDVVFKEHERIDGSGYPGGLKGDQIDELTQIVGLADMYEAKIHLRPYRRKYSSLETMKEISSLKDSFDFRLIKVLIERLGIFPIGTLVYLNTKEIGIVIKGNSSSPLRPVIDIIYDSNGQKLLEPKRFDLSRNAVVYIKECLDHLGKDSDKISNA